MDFRSFSTPVAEAGCGVCLLLTSNHDAVESHGLFENDHEVVSLGNFFDAFGVT
jgi:hypothetical protein